MSLFGLFSSARQSSNRVEASPSSVPPQSRPNKENEPDLLHSAIQTGSSSAVEYALARRGGTIERKPSDVVHQINTSGATTANKVNIFNLFAGKFPGFSDSIQRDHSAQNTLESGHSIGPFLIT